MAGGTGEAPNTGPTATCTRVHAPHAGQPITHSRAGDICIYVLYNVVLIPWAVCVAAGEWQFDKKDGRGKMTGANNSYEGEWSAGKRHGKGTAKFDNGSGYEGEWVSDRYACVERERVYVGRAHLQRARHISNSHALCRRRWCRCCLGVGVSVPPPQGSRQRCIPDGGRQRIRR